MLPLLESINVESAFGRFRVKRGPAHPLQLLIVDCETQRFTIERPSSVVSFDAWCKEVDHAVTAGRHIVCVPINDSSIEEIESLGTGLGYVLWPSMTILAPPASNGMAGLSEFIATTGRKLPKEEEHKLRLLARVGVV